MQMDLQNQIATDGTTTKYKARLVEKGYSQVQGLDYNEIVTPVSIMHSVRLVLAIAASKRWEVHHMDVKSSSWRFGERDLYETT